MCFESDLDFIAALACSDSQQIHHDVIDMLKSMIWAGILNIAFVLVSFDLVTASEVHKALKLIDF